MKRIVSLILCAVLVMGMLPSIAFAATTVASGTCGDNLTWVLDSDGLLTISGSGDMEDYDYWSDVPWYSNRSKITSVSLPQGLTTIGANAFRSCSSLTSITIPDSVTTIGDSAFYNCDSLTSITIPDSVTTIGEYAFYGCENLTGITIPDSVTTIGDSAFSNCYRLTGITIPDSVTTIGKDAFRACSSLTSVSIGNGVTTIGDGAFGFCLSLTGIWVNESNGYFSSNSSGILFDKRKETLIAFPGGISGTYTILDSVTTIGDQAFYECRNLTGITIPDSVTSIGEYAFFGCNNLTDITIPDSVTTIGDYAFRSCSSLTDITIPDSVTSIGQYAFAFCYSLTDITIPDSVTSIGDSAFGSCTSLTSASIGSGVTTIGDAAFGACGSLTGIWVNESNRYYSSNSSGVLFDKAKETLIAFPGGVSGAYTIPDSVTSIGNYAFHSCSSLTGITIPDSVTSIGNYAFYNCYSLTGITIPDSVTSIGEGAFESCSSLTEVHFDGAAPSFGSVIFYKVTATAYYHGSNTTWTSDKLQSYGGTITWQSVSCTRETLPAVAATCTETGLTAGNACSVCGQVFTAQTVIPALGHDWNAATCTSPKTCKRCYTTSGSALGHDWLDATCTAPKTCSICGETSGSALGHSWSAATCTEPKTCTKCNITSGTALGHSWNAATCTSPKTCSRCSLTSGTALGHNWDGGTVTKQPTESETGIKTYQCTRCTETKTETIPALAHTHNYTSVVTNPTCTQQGYTTYTCACGDTYKSNYTPALNHNYVDGICTRCGEADSGYEPPKPTVDGVYRIAGADRIETSIGIANALKETLGVEKFSNIVVASALNFPDALAGSYLAALKDAPILLTYDAVHAKIAQYIADNLENHGTVYILGGEGAVSKKFEYELSARVVHFERVAGNDRFSTNMRILETAKVPTGSTVLVCTALNFADSLSVSATGLPILLVHGSLRPDQMVFLNMVKPEAIYVVGGTSAVSDATMKEIKDLLPNATLERIWGENRHVTSATVATEFFPDAKSAVVAYSRNFPDGLCGGPLAYALGAPLLLTVSGDKTPNAYTDYYEINTGYVLGSGELVNDPSVRNIFHMSTADPIN